MSKARRVAKILDGELKSDELTLKDGSDTIKTQKDANQELLSRVEDIESGAVKSHDHPDYAASDHVHSGSEHEHDATYADKRHRHDTDYATAGHSHDSKYELLTHATSEHERLDDLIADHTGTEHNYLPLAGGDMDTSAQINWPANTGVIDGLDEARSPQSPVRKKEFDAALLGGDDNLAKIEANTDAIEKEVQDRKDADALKADKDHTHPSGPHTHDEYQPKGDYAAGDHTHQEQDLTHDHDGTYATEAHRHDAVYAPIHPHPYAADDHDHDADYVHDHPYAADDHNHDAEYVHEHPYAADDHTHPPQDLTHDHDDQYFAKGGESDDDGNPLPLPYLTATRWVLRWMSMGMSSLTPCTWVMKNRRSLRRVTSGMTRTAWKCSSGMTVDGSRPRLLEHG